MNRRHLIAAVVAAAFLPLSGCAPVLTNPAEAPDDAFTPAGAEKRMSSAATLDAVRAVYGSETRTLSAPRRPKAEQAPEQSRADEAYDDEDLEKVAVWEWLAARPSFHTKKSIRSYCTPTVKKELHVRYDAQRRVIDWRLVGMFYVQFRLPGFSANVTELRMLDAAELADTRVPVASEEDYREVNAYYAKIGGRENTALPATASTLPTPSSATPSESKTSAPAAASGASQAVPETFPSDEVQPTDTPAHAEDGTGQQEWFRIR